MSAAALLGSLSAKATKIYAFLKTHNHPDQIGWNNKPAAQCVRILAHQSLRRCPPGPKLLIPQ